MPLGATDAALSAKLGAMRLPTWIHSLSARLLVLTISFVMVSEVLIFTPSIARYRLTWLEEKLSDGYLAALSVLAAPEAMVTRELENALLAAVGAYTVDMRVPPRTRTYMLGPTRPPEPDNFVTVGGDGVVALIIDAYESLFNGNGRIMRIEGRPSVDPEAYVVMIVDETELCEALLGFSWRILALSIVISLITASLVFLALRWLAVRPLMELSGKMVAFRSDPEDSDNIIVPGGRSDEVGVAQRELHDMQIALRDALKQKTRLAALGTAVTKINHDLRNILATASMVSERLTLSDDPEVQRTVPKLFDAIDRAVALCGKTLTYTRDGGPPLRRTNLSLHILVDEAEPDLASARGGDTRWVNAVPDHVTVQADRDALMRVLVNIGRNAFQAGATTVTVAAEKEADGIQVTITDDGPGLPPRARENLFKPFAGSSRKGGTGLGLAIAREIVVAHRGELALVASGAKGTAFRVTLPI